MACRRRDIDALLAAGANDAAIACLSSEGPIQEPWKLALLARAYYQRGDSRGDLFAGDFFARRALAAGFSESWLADICEGYHAGVGRPGMSSPRPVAGTAALAGHYRFSALSVDQGEGDAVKDFDWISRNVPCQEACPARTDIPAYLTAIFDGDPEHAYRLNLESNVFPGVLGRVCARPCEADCRHGWDGLGDSVAICSSKRAAADLREAGPVVLEPLFPPTGRSVAVVGSGVAGLTVARELARWGHKVVVYERHSRPGGMLNQGIPEFRLPRSIIHEEIEQIRAMGVDVICNVAIGADLSLRELLATHDAVVLAAGTLRPNRLDLPGVDLAGVMHGLEFMLEANENRNPPVGRHVVVIGGGFTAMDCARTAKRLGAQTLASADAGASAAEPGAVLRAPDDHVNVWYRRTEKEMLITPGELDELRHEGIDMEFLVSPVRFLGEDGYVTEVEFIRNSLGKPDNSGRCRPIPIPGSEFRVPADTVLMATGQFPDTTWIDRDLLADLVGDDGWLQSGTAAGTAVPGVFVAGDFAQGASSLISAIGHAKLTAREIDAFLVGETRLQESIAVGDARETGRIREMDAVPVQAMPCRPPAARDAQAEVDTGYTAGLAVDEAQRCYRCHFKYEIDSDRCIYCDWCVKAKPRPECILKVRELHYDNEGRIVGWEKATCSDDAYLIWINQTDCIRCGACLDACPVDAITLRKVSRVTQSCTHSPTPENQSHDTRRL